MRYTHTDLLSAIQSFETVDRNGQYIWLDMLSGNNVANCMREGSIFSREEAIDWSRDLDTIGYHLVTDIFIQKTIFDDGVEIETAYQVEDVEKDAKKRRAKVGVKVKGKSKITHEIFTSPGKPDVEVTFEKPTSIMIDNIPIYPILSKDRLLKNHKLLEAIVICDFVGFEQYFYFLDNLVAQSYTYATLKLNEGALLNFRTRDAQLMDSWKSDIFFTNKSGIQLFESDYMGVDVQAESIEELYNEIVGVSNRLKG